MTEPTRPAEAVDITEGKRRVEGGALLLDVRNPDEWHAGHVDGSTWIPMGEVTDRQGELPTDREIVVACAVGGRSARVAEALNAWGYNAVNLAGGLKAWVEADLPIVTDDGDGGTVL